MKHPLLPVICALVAARASAQVQEVWSATFDGAFPQTFRDTGGPLAVLPDGSSYQLGTCHDFLPLPGHNRFHVALVKRGPDGLFEWNRFEPVGASRIRPVEVLAAGNGDAVVLASTEDTSGPSTFGRMLYRHDSSGVLVWSRVDGIEYTVPTDLLAASNGDLFVAGSDEGRFAVERFDAAGTSLWKYFWPVPPGTWWGDLPYALAQHANGDVVAVGYVYDAGDSRPAIARIAPDGMERWSRILPQAAGFASVAVDAAGNTYAVQHFTTPPAVVAFDATGGQLWSRPLPGVELLSSFPFERSLIRLDPLGRLIVVARTTSVDSTGDLALRIIDVNGTILLERSVDFGFPSGDRPRGLEFSSDGEIVVSTIVGASPSSWIPALAAFDLAGNLRWTRNSGIPTDPQAGVEFAPAPGGAWLLSSTQIPATGSNSDLRLARVERTARPVCGGDGVPPTCPCGNASQPIEQAGCANGLGMGGRLVDVGSSQLTADSLELVGSGMTDGIALYFQGSTLAPLAFGDGLRCAGGATRRLGTRTNANGTSRFPGPGGTPISIAGAVSSAGERDYQIWYRDTSAFCTSATFNVTNALVVRWY